MLHQKQQIRRHSALPINILEAPQIGKTPLKQKFNIIQKSYQQAVTKLNSNSKPETSHERFHSFQFKSSNSRKEVKSENPRNHSKGKSFSIMDHKNQKQVNLLNAKRPITGQVSPADSPLLSNMLIRPFKEPK